MSYSDLCMYGLHSCDDCGAVVKDGSRDLHDKWHAELDEDLVDLETGQAEREPHLRHDCKDPKCDRRHFTNEGD